MNESSPKIIDLSTLGEGNGMPGLGTTKGADLVDAAAVCLEDRSHQPGVEMQLNGIEPGACQLRWSPVDEQKRRTHNDLDEATELGACGIAILLVKELTGMVVVQRSKKGLGFDYWLGDGDDDLLFTGKARLEVSGLRSASAGEITTRVKQKGLQTKPSSRLAPGYVAVIEFSRPIAHVIEAPHDRP